MRILLSWLQDFIDLKNFNANQVTDYLTQLGLEVDSYDKINDFDFYKDLIVGKVIECCKHHNADKLHLTKVEVGNNKILNIVCGAPNVREGIYVVVAPENVTLKPFSGEQIKIKKSKIRGEVSEGMLCAEDEIGLSSDHEKIIELSNTYPVGTKISEVFNKKTDYVFEVDLTPNRWYAASHIGIARDLNAKIKFLNHEQFSKNFNTYIEKLDELKILSDFTIKIHDENICDRYCGLLCKNIKIQESPTFIQERLKSVGMNPINNIVDITNYVMLEIGQPLHAYDFDKINGNIHVKLSKERIKTLKDQECDLDDDIVICDDKNILGVAGIIGGKGSSISSDTKNVFFESAIFNPSKIRQTSQRLKIKTDASARFEHGIDNSMQIYALQRVYNLLKEQQKDIDFVGYVDVKNTKHENTKIKTSFSNIDKLIGQKINHSDISNILENLNIVINKIDSDIFETVIPFYRKNIQCEADIIDEILRVYGYEKLQCKDYCNVICKEHENISCAAENNIENNIANILCANGFYEIKTNSLVPKSCEIHNPQKKCIKLLNASSNNFEILRQDLVFSGLEVIKYNINNKNSDLKLFEFGKIYFENEDKENVEEQHLVIFITGNVKNSWREKTREVDFYDLKDIVFNIFHPYNLDHFDYRKNESENIEVLFKDEIICKLGNVKKTILEEYEIKQNVFYADINFDRLCKIIKKIPKTIYKKITKTPVVKRDLSLILDKNVKYIEIENVIKKMNEKRIINMNLFSVFEDKKIGEDKKTYSISFYLQDEEKMLNNIAIQNIMDKIMNKFENDLNAIIIKNL